MFDLRWMTLCIGPVWLIQSHNILVSETLGHVGALHGAVTIAVELSLPAVACSLRFGIQHGVQCADSPMWGPMCVIFQQISQKSQHYRSPPSLLHKDEVHAGTCIAAWTGGPTPARLAGHFTALMSIVVRTLQDSRRCRLEHAVANKVLHIEL